MDRVAKAGIKPGGRCCRLPWAPPVEFPLPARHPRAQHPTPQAVSDAAALAGCAQRDNDRRPGTVWCSLGQEVVPDLLI